MKNSTIIKHITKEPDGEKTYTYRLDPSYMGTAKSSLLPESIAMEVKDSSNNITQSIKAKTIEIDKPIDNKLFSNIQN